MLRSFNAGRLQALAVVLSLGLFPLVARADFTKTITVTPGVEVNAVTTWYYSNCTTILGTGTYTVNVEPTQGVLAFSGLSAPIPGCPAGSPSLPAAAAYYTWTGDTACVSSDYFQLYYELNGAVAEVIDVTVALSQPPTCTISSRTLATVPGISDSRTQVGIGEFVALETDTPATWTIQSGQGCLTETEPVADQSQTCAASITGSQSFFTAPYATDNTVILATLPDGSSCSIPFSTVQPSGLVFQRLLKPGYGFDPPSLTRGIAMWAAVFVTPGDVSFANIGIAEEDIEHPYTSHLHTPSVLVPVGGSNAWLFHCDYNAVPLAFDGHSPIHQWVYTWGAKTYAAANKVPFSRVQTELSRTFLFFWGNYDFTKGQVEALSGGSFASTPDALKAELQVAPRSPTSHLVPLNDASCAADVEAQFGVPPSNQVQTVHR